MKKKPGPKPLIPDEELDRLAKEEAINGIFHSQGYKKITSRLNVSGHKCDKNRVYKSLKKQNLLCMAQKPESNGSARIHDGVIIEDFPNRMWGTDGKRFYTQEDGWCWYFSVIDHCTDEILGWHVAKIGTRFEALEPVKFEYYIPGNWYTTQNFSTGGTTLYDTDTTAGVEIDVTMTDTNSYHLVMTPLSNPGIAYSEDGNFSTETTNGPINWVTYQLYNTDSDFYNVDTNSGLSYPTNAPCGPNPTDFYIKSMTLAGLLLNIQLAGTNAVLSWTTNAPGFNLASSLNLGASAAWSTNNLTSPVVVNGQNVVTNPIAGTQQFYRLEH